LGDIFDGCVFKLGHFFQFGLQRVAALGNTDHANASGGTANTDALGATVHEKSLDATVHEKAPDGTPTGKRPMTQRPEHVRPHNLLVWVSW
jgi:hypothetical protein